MNTRTTKAATQKAVGMIALQVICETMTREELTKAIAAMTTAMQERRAEGGAELADELARIIAAFAEAI